MHCDPLTETTACSHPNESVVFNNVDPQCATRTLMFVGGSAIWQRASFELCISARLERDLSYCLNPFYVVPQCRVRSLSVDGCLLLFVSSFRAYSYLWRVDVDWRIYAPRCNSVSDSPLPLLFFLPCVSVQIVLAKTITCITRADITKPGFRTSRKQQRPGQRRSRMAELWISIRSCMQSAPTWVKRV